MVAFVLKSYVGAFECQGNVARIVRVFIKEDCGSLEKILMKISRIIVVD
jgi:hypothetical protein